MHVASINGHWLAHALAFIRVPGCRRGVHTTFAQDLFSVGPYRSERYGHASFGTGIVHHILIMNASFSTVFIMSFIRTSDRLAPG